SSLSLNGFEENSGYTAETKAMCLPSGDQRAEAASVLMFVSCRASPPARAMTQSCIEPPRFDSKRMYLPSGDQRGWRSFLPGTLVSWRGSPLPVVGASQMLDGTELPSMSTVPTV